MKKIICCLDGTWNDNRPGSILTNVAKLHRLIAATDAAGVPQHAHYVTGIVSDAEESYSFIKGAIGLGVSDRIRRAYQHIAERYEPGDEIHLFGFSRGAFEVRSLASFIGLVGVLRRDGEVPLETAWHLYQSDEQDRKADDLAAMRAASHYPVRIKCVGVWDTVGNIGNPFASGGPAGRITDAHDLRLTDIFDVGLHALSIDEFRGPFRPTLWTLPEGRALPAGQHVEQVWFAGSHADVGGGYRETALSDIGLTWMIERAEAKCGLAFDRKLVREMTRPDPLGPQHSAAGTGIFRISALLPYIRLVRQATGAVPRARRLLLGDWRTGRLPAGEVSVNESLHESVIERFGKRVVELTGGHARVITYGPANLAASFEPGEQTSGPLNVVRKDGESRRVKIFTVHGTFANEADWDNWDDRDDPARPGDQRMFVNRLAEQLKSFGVAFDKADHTEYNWSGGNSHDERRVAAIGLKKTIEEVLSKTYASVPEGAAYYDKVFVIGHSHGGTVARLAMNLWDKEPDYYGPETAPGFDELKHDDVCGTCLRTRHGPVGRNTVRRPDGVITFGSPFVTFEKRWGSLVSATIAAWIYRILAIVPLLLLLRWFMAEPSASTAIVKGQVSEAQGSLIRTALILLFPLQVYWLLAVHWGGGLRRWTARRLGDGTDPPLAIAIVLKTLRAGLLAGVAAYYLIWASDAWATVAGRAPALAWIGGLFWHAVVGINVWLLIVTLPSVFMRWMRGEVVKLREKLPRKYDPVEDRVTPYLSYHTIGDEAGFHLRAFGVLTWLVQTSAIATVSVLAAGIVLSALIGVEALGKYVLKGPTLLSHLGISAWEAEPAYLRDNFIAVMNRLTYVPELVWTGLFHATSPLSLSALADPRSVAPYVPAALVTAIAVVFLGLMPIVLILVGTAYLVSMRLRGSGLVFGSESFAWTMANRIGVKLRANENTEVRVVSIAPEAWRRQELAHCYYYKSEAVITDLAGRLARWEQHRPTAGLPVGNWLSLALRLAVVGLFVTSLFALSVPIAKAFADKSGAIGQPGTGTDPGAAAETYDSGLAVCRSQSVSVSFEMPAGTAEAAVKEEGRRRWTAEVTARHGAEWANLGYGSQSSGCTSLGGAPKRCDLSAQPCRLKPLECQSEPVAVETAFDVSPGVDPAMLGGIEQSVTQSLRERWTADVEKRFGAGWGDRWYNFVTLERVHATREACRREQLPEGRTRFQCEVATTPCRKPAG